MPDLFGQRRLTRMWMGTILGCVLRAGSHTAMLVIIAAKMIKAPTSFGSVHHYSMHITGENKFNIAM